MTEARPFTTAAIENNIMHGLSMNQSENLSVEDLERIRYIQKIAHSDIMHQIAEGNKRQQITPRIIEKYAKLCMEGSGYSHQAHRVVKKILEQNLNSLITPSLVKALFLDIPLCAPQIAAENIQNLIYKEKMREIKAKKLEQSNGLLTRFVSAVKNENKNYTPDYIWYIKAIEELNLKISAGVIFDGHEAVSVFVNSMHKEIRAMVTPSLLNQMKSIYVEHDIPHSWNKIVDVLRDSEYTNTRELAAFQTKLPVPEKKEATNRLALDLG